ncbi:MAG TPA: peptidase MA family metallohydrolase [Terriglobales bacterium]|nr:peptidase MA family metallohydrolase [Terriglobales bacterium]
MRIRVTLLTASLLFFCSFGEPRCVADTILLKNGRKIWADHVREDGTHVEYEIGEDSYKIPKSSVERIEAGGVAPMYASSSGSSDSKELPTFVPEDGLSGHDDLAGRVIREGKVDTDALTQLEKEGKPALSATAYFLAGKHEFEHGNLPQAKRYFESALGFQPDNSTILNYYAMALVRSGNASAALSYAERSVRAKPDSADAYTVLGYVEFANDRSKDAIRAWKRSLELRPDSVVEQYLAKAQREEKAENDFSQRESSHFTLRYEGQQTSEQLRRELIATLEAEYDDLVRQLGVAPRASIPVILYTQQAFFDVTQAPSWSGAVNDGKLRIPVSGVSSMTSDLARVLKHELAHSFVSQISGGRCPTWLNEGVAQAMEPKSLGSDGRRLGELFRSQREIPYNVLEGSFMRFSSVEAYVAYAESLAAVQYISTTYGMSDVVRILERIGQGSAPEAALRATIHSDYGQLATEVGKFLANQ